MVAAIVAVSMIAALNFSTISAFAQNATSGNKINASGNATSGNMTGGNTTSSSSAVPKSPTSSAAAGPNY